MPNFKNLILRDTGSICFCLALPLVLVCSHWYCPQGYLDICHPRCTHTCRYSKKKKKRRVYDSRVLNILSKHRNTHLLFCITVFDGLQDRYTLPQTFVKECDWFIISKIMMWKIYKVFSYLTVRQMRVYVPRSNYDLFVSVIINILDGFSLQDTLA